MSQVKLIDIEAESQMVMQDIYISFLCLCGSNLSFIDLYSDNVAEKKENQCHMCKRQYKLKCIVEVLEPTT